MSDRGTFPFTHQTASLVTINLLEQVLESEDVFDRRREKQARSAWGDQNGFRGHKIAVRRPGSPPSERVPLYQAGGSPPMPSRDVLVRELSRARAAVEELTEQLEDVRAQQRAAAQQADAELEARAADLQMRLLESEMQRSAAANQIERLQGDLRFFIDSDAVKSAELAQLGTALARLEAGRRAQRQLHEESLKANSDLKAELTRLVKQHAEERRADAQRQAELASLAAARREENARHEAECSELRRQLATLQEDNRSQQLARDEFEAQLRRLHAEVTELRSTTSQRQHIPANVRASPSKSPRLDDLQSVLDRAASRTPTAGDAPETPDAAARQLASKLLFRSLSTERVADKADALLRRDIEIRDAAQRRIDRYLGVPDDDEEPLDVTDDVDAVPTIDSDAQPTAADPTHSDRARSEIAAVEESPAADSKPADEQSSAEDESLSAVADLMRLFLLTAVNEEIAPAQPTPADTVTPAAAAVVVPATVSPRSSQTVPRPASTTTPRSGAASSAVRSASVTTPRSAAAKSPAGSASSSPRSSTPRNADVGDAGHGRPPTPQGGSAAVARSPSVELQLARGANPSGAAPPAPVQLPRRSPSLDSPRRVAPPTSESPRVRPPTPTRQASAGRLASPRAVVASASTLAAAPAAAPSAPALAFEGDRAQAAAGPASTPRLATTQVSDARVDVVRPFEAEDSPPPARRLPPADLPKIADRPKLPELPEGFGLPRSPLSLAKAAPPADGAPAHPTQLPNALAEQQSNGVVPPAASRPPAATASTPDPARDDSRASSRRGSVADAPIPAGGSRRSSIVQAADTVTVAKVRKTA